MHRLPLDDLLDSYIPRYIVDITFIRFFPPGGNCDWMNLLLRLAHVLPRIFPYRECVSQYPYNLNFRVNKRRTNFHCYKWLGNVARPQLRRIQSLLNVYLFAPRLPYSLSIFSMRAHYEGASKWPRAWRASPLHVRLSIHRSCIVVALWCAITLFNSICREHALLLHVAFLLTSNVKTWNFIPLFVHLSRPRNSRESYILIIIT